VEWLTQLFWNSILLTCVEEVRLDDKGLYVFVGSYRFAKNEPSVHFLCTVKNAPVM
jgi:hypothetical protein